MTPIDPVSIPSLFITGTDTGIGKTVIAGAIANWFHRQGSRVAVCKPIATGCVHRREGLVSEDAEFLAVCASARHPLDLICPQRFAEPLAPSVAARRAGQPVDWEAIDRSIKLMSRDSDVMIVEAAGGIMTPIDDRHAMLDLARMLGAPAVIVARAALGTINHTVLTINAIREAGISVAGVVINRYPADTPGVAEETSPREIERMTKVPILCVVPEEPVPAAELPPGIVAAINLVDWQRLARKSAH